MSHLLNHIKNLSERTKHKIFIFTLILTIAYGVGLRIERFHTISSPAPLLLTNVITNEAWTLVNYSKLFSITEEFYLSIHSPPDPTKKYLYQIDKIPKPENPTFRLQQGDEHGTSLLLAAIWKLTNSFSIYWLIALQIIIDTLCFFLLYRTGKNFFNPTIGLLATLGYVRWPAQINFVNMIHTYQWTTIFSIFILFIISEYYKKKTPSIPKNIVTFALIGLIIGTSIWFRSSSQALLISTLLFLFFIFKNFKNILISGTTIVLVTIFTLLPLLAFNYHHTGDLFISRGIKWHTFIAGLGAVDNPYGIINGDGNVKTHILNRNPDIKSYIGPYETHLKPYEAEAKKFYFEIFKENPLLIIKAFGARLIRLDSWTKGGIGQKIEIGFILYCFLYVLIFIPKRKSPLNSLLIYSLSYYTIIAVIYFTKSTYIAPIYPALYLIAAHSIWNSSHKSYKYLLKSHATQQK